MQIKKESIIRVAIAMFFVALLEPNGILYSPLHGLMGILRYAAFFLSFVLLVIERLYRERIPMLMVVFVACVGVSTCLYSGEIGDSYLYMFRTLFACIVLSTYCLKVMPRYYIYMMGFIFSLWLLLDGLTWVESGTYITANGQRAFFLGTKTSITYYLVPALGFNFAAREITAPEFRRYVNMLNMMALGGSVLYLIREPISAAIICLLLGTVGWTLINNWDKVSENIVKFGFWITSGFNFLFISGNILGMFSHFFTAVLGEDAHLNGRTQIWNMVLYYISERPWVGYGYSSGVRFDVWQSFNTSTHNYFLNILFMSGVVGFGFYICIIIAIHLKNRKLMHSDICRYLMFLLVIMNIEAIAESYGFNVMTFVFMVLLCYVENIVACGYDYSGDIYNVEK